MRTTEPQRWQDLLDKVASITPETLAKFRAQELFYLLGRAGTISDKDLFCTVEGLNRQLDEFSCRHGIVYYVDESSMSLKKEAFEKTWEDQYENHS